LPTVGNTVAAAAASIPEEVATALSTGESVAASQAAATLQSKRVEYVIALDDDQGRNKAKWHVRRQVAPGSTVEAGNRVDQAFLRSRPIAVSIETKAPNGGELHGWA
jgi:hypothetical protein